MLFIIKIKYALTIFKLLILFPNTMKNKRNNKSFLDAFLNGLRLGDSTEGSTEVNYLRRYHFNPGLYFIIKF